MGVIPFRSFMVKYRMDRIWGGWCLLMIVGMVLPASPLLGTIKVQKKAAVSERFVTKVAFPYQGARPQSVIYGNDNYGYFKTKSFTMKGNSLVIELLPPGYRFEVGFFVRGGGAKGLKKIGDKRFISPVPEAYRSHMGRLNHGRFTPNYFMVAGALPRGQFWNPNFKPRNPDIYKKSRYRFSFGMILNRFGEIVWLHVPVDGHELFHTYITMRQVRKGVYGLLLGKKAGFFQKVNFDGQILHELRSRDAKEPFTMHHDFWATSHDSIIAISSRKAVSQTPKAKKIGKTFLADTLIKVDLKQGQSRKVFDFLKIYRPTVNPFWTGDDEGDHKFVSWNEDKVDFDFLHLNSIEKLSDGYLVGVRNLNKVVMMDPMFKRVKWSLGWNSDDTFQIKSDEDRFHHMHTPIQVANGNIALFDNGYKKERSRVVEYQLDYRNQKAHVVWSYTPNPSLYSKDRGSIHALKNRNIVAYFVNPIENKGSEPVPPKDVLVEIDYRKKIEKARMTRTFPVLSPGYRAIPINEIGLEDYMGPSL